MTNQDTTKITTLGIVIWLLASGFFLYEFLLRTLIGTVATQLIADLSLTTSQFALLGSAYYFAYGIMQIPVGIIADKFGVRVTLIFAVAVCALSAYCLAASHEYIYAMLSRVLMGFGSSFAFVCLLMVVADWFPTKNFAAFAGASQFIGTMGPLLSGGPIATLLTRLHGDWRYLISKIGLCGIVLLTLILLFVKEKPRQATNHLIFIKRPARILESLKHTFRNKQVVFVAMYSAFTYASMALLGAVWGTIYLQAHGFSQTTAAKAVSFGWLGYAIGCLALGPISDFLRRRRTVMASCASLGVLTTACITFTNSHAIIIYELLFLLLGVAASGQAIACATVSEHANDDNRATAFGMNNGSVIIFNVVFPPTVGFLIGMSSSHHVTTPLVPSDFHTGFIIMPVLFFIALLNSLFCIKETYCKPQSEVVILNTN